MYRTALYPIYQEYQGKLVEFAGYEMPAQYDSGVKGEHLWCREHAGLFDVSHMGQAWLVAQSGSQVDALAAMEELVGADLQALSPGKQQYTQLLNDRGGILDDLIITRCEKYSDRLYTVVNAACKERDFAYIEEKLAGRVRLEHLEERALIALQGPEAVSVAQKYFPGVEQQSFMTWQIFAWNVPPASAALEAAKVEVYISRSGYTGEDGVEISVPNEYALTLARLLLAEPAVKPMGLGARDSLRLEAGLCLYGADMDETTSPIEAGLQWSIGKRRRTAGADNFAGAEVILRQITERPSRKRVGLDIQGKAPCRAGVAVYGENDEKLGEVCSGVLSPSLEKPIAMAYVKASHIAIGTAVWLELRGKRIPAKVCKMPFIAPKYAK
ncbi:MAG: glycine cleavage system aminomethyltransferase GcvT [Spirochaetota bacterium]